jgi:hypothetical protein
MLSKEKIQNPKPKYVCGTCKKVFIMKGRYDYHIKTVKCDWVCEGCDKQAESKTAFYRHRKVCEDYKNYKNAKSIVHNDNTNNINNIDSSAKVGTMNNNNVNNNNNVVLLQPFDVDHYYMKKSDMLGPSQKTVVNFLLQEKYFEAYNFLFQHIHGNEKYPEHHNIYLPHLDKNDLVVFKGKDFKIEKVEKQMPRLFGRLRYEMSWIVKGSKDLTPKQRDQLLWDIKAHWSNVNETNDPHMKLALRNNKNVVLDTMKNNIVKPDKEMIQKFLDLKQDKYQKSKNRIYYPSVHTINTVMDQGLEDLDENHIVKLP